MKITSTLVLLFFFSSQIVAQPSYQLATPLLKYESVFFTKQALVELQFRFSGSQIRYTLDGSEPTESDRLYRRPVSIKKGFTTLKGRVFATGFKGSETVQATFIQDGLKIQQASFPNANERFGGTGETTLIDNKGGKPAIASSTWLGYQDDSVDIVLTLEKSQQIKQVLIDFLEDHASWVFLPEKIEVFYSDPVTGERRLFGNLSNPADNVVPGARCEYRIIESHQPIIAKTILVRLSVLKSIPATHPGKGMKSWTFIDEIKVY
ncbi:MAG TPA: chitobiase/beta-hexosaminidase C-terminal domain-containing protein [Flavitalea sp.]|nr:chitobiase/beta-hexosaminidase C-terminal domain-containing protein [Flavitalea sp.]